MNFSLDAQIVEQFSRDSELKVRVFRDTNAIVVSVGRRTTGLIVSSAERILPS
jgi:hypothetical protein